MTEAAVNLGAAGFVSYFNDGGAAVDFPVEEDIYAGPSDEEKQAVVSRFQEAGFLPEDSEPGLTSLLGDMVIGSDDPDAFDGELLSRIRSSASANSPGNEQFYPDGNSFFQQLSTEYGYPQSNLPDGSRGIEALEGRTRNSTPYRRDDLPTPQELSDARSHMLASAMAASQYGPKTANLMGIMEEGISVTPGGRANTKMDKRNNAVGRRIFAQAGMNATTAELTKQVDQVIFNQLNTIMGRSEEEQGPSKANPGHRKNWESDAQVKGTQDEGQLYFPRKESGKFLTDFPNY